MKNIKHKRNHHVDKNDDCASYMWNHKTISKSHYLFIDIFRSRKKRKDSLETRAEWVVLRFSVENQALEPVLLYRASWSKRTKKQDSENCLWTHIFTFFGIIVSSFSSFCQNAKKTGLNCAIIDQTLSKKQKLVLYKT